MCGGGGIAPYLFISALNKRAQLDGLAVVPQEKEPAVPIVEEAGWAPKMVWTLWKREKSLASVGNQTPALQPVAIGTEPLALKIQK
jgi:hypothetical protein